MPLLAVKDRPSLAAFLLYDSFDPEAAIFVHRDGSLAALWELGMKDTEAAGPAELESLSSRIADFFRHLPAGSAAQFILTADRDIKEPLARFEEGLARNSPLRPLFAAHLENLRTLSFRHEGSSFVARRLRVLFALRDFPTFGGAPEGLQAAYARARERFLESASAVENLFAELGLPWKRLDADAAVDLLFRTLNPLRAQGAPPRRLRTDLPIRDQLVRTPVRFDYRTGVLDLGGRFFHVLSMVQVPERTFPGMLTRPLPAAPGVLELLPEATVVLNLGLLDDAQARRRLEKRDAFAWRQLQGPRRKLDLVRIKEDAESALGELLSGRRALAVRLHLLVSGASPEEALEKSRAASSALDRLGIEMVEEEALGFSLFLQCLPGLYDPGCDRGLKRAFTMISSNVADLVPLYGSFLGTRTPEILLQNRRGEPVGFSIFDSDVAPHAIVTGVSGAGKSFFMNYLLASAALRGAHVVVLDRGHSYRNLCELLGGQYVNFDPDRPLRMNPVGAAEAMTKERLLFVKDILSEMCAQGEEPIRKEERTVLENAVLRAAEKRRSGELFLSHVYEALLEEARLAPRSLARDFERLSLSLKPFVGNGAYAGFFDGPSAIDFSSPFTVFELGDLALRREVAPALLMAILHNVAGFASEPRNLALRKVVVLDEAWTLLQSPATARFVENALRTYRKLNAAAIMVTQQVSDFQGASGAAIRANAPNRIFLRQTPETVQAMEALFELSPEVKEALAGLVTAKGRFSELLIETPTARGVARLVPSRELHAAFSTDGEDRARLRRRVEELRAAGEPHPLLAALRELEGGRGA